MAIDCKNLKRNMCLCTIYTMRKRLFEIIETAKENDRLSNVYDIFMMIVIVVSLIPLAIKGEHPVFEVIDKVAAGVFIVDYLLRWCTADYKLNKRGWSFLLYPITPMAIMDLLCILPSLSIINKGFKVLKVFRLFRTLRVLRVFKSIRYSKSIQMIRGVFRSQKKPLITVGILAAAYILVSALVVFNVEPESFKDFFDAVYWATVSLTTMGYGDIYPVTTVGRIVTMVSSIFGIAIIALPAGIITAGYMEELNKSMKNGTEDTASEPKESADEGDN